MKKTSKILAILLAMVMLFCLCACEKEEEPEPVPDNGNATIDELLEQGFECHSMSYYNDDKLMYLEYKAADLSDFVLVSCTMEEADAEEFFAIDSFDESCQQLYSNFLVDYEVTATSLKDKIPADSEFAEFVGKPIQALVDAGYEQSSLGNDEEGILYFEYSNENYTVMVHTEKEYEALFDLGDVDLNTLVVKSVQFCDFEDWLSNL